MHPIVADVVLGLRLVVKCPDLDAAGAEVGDQALLDGDLAAALAEREAVAADVGELAADERDLLRVFKGHHAVDRADRGLIRHGRGERRQAFGMAEGEPPEGEVSDLVARLAGEGQQLLGDGIGRDGFLDGLATARQVGQLAGAAQEPFAGLIEQRKQVLDDHAGMMVEGGVSLLGRPADLQGTGSDVGGFDTAASGVPFMEECDQGILGLGRFHLTERRQLLRVDADSLFREAGGRYATRNRGLALDAAHEAAAEVTRAGAGRPAVSDPQLLERLGACRNL